MLRELLVALAITAACASAAPLAWDTNNNNGTLNACAAAPLYKQCDPRWKNDRIGTSSTTICAVGCAMSSLSMYLSARGTKLNPQQLNNWLIHNGGYSGGDELVWSAANKFHTVAFQGIETSVSEATLAAGIAACHGIIANVHEGRHWVLLTGHRGGGVFDVHDPGFETTTYPLSQMLRFAVYHP